MRFLVGVPARTKAGLERADTPDDHDPHAYRPGAHLPIVRRKLRVYGWRAGTVAAARCRSRSHTLSCLPTTPTNAAFYSQARLRRRTPPGWHYSRHAAQPG